MSQALRRRIEQLEQGGSQENGYWAYPLAHFYGEDVPPVWRDSTRRAGLDAFYSDLENETQNTPKGADHG